MIHKFLTEYRTEVLLFSLTFILRFGAFITLVLLAHTLDFQYPVIGTDSGGYVSTARNMLAGGGFTTVGGPEPQSYIMPGYSLFILLILLIFKSIYAVVIVQDILAGLAAVLVYRIGTHISKNVGFMGAILFSIDPIGIFFTNVILTEMLFIFFLLVASYTFLRGETNSRKDIFFAGSMLGIATLTRPSGIVLPVAFLGVLIIRYGFLSKQWVTPAFLFILGFAIMVFPWSARNKILFDTWELTAVATTQWYQNSAPLYYAYRHNISHEEANAIFRARLMEINPNKDDAGTLRNTPYMRRVVIESLSEDPFGYMKFHIIKSIPFFFSDGLRDIARRMNILDRFQSNIGDLLLRGDVRALWGAFNHNGLSSWLLVVGGGMWGLIFMSMIAGLIFYWRFSISGRTVLLFSFLVIFTTLLIAAGPNANARYRFSISPFFFLLAAAGFSQLRARIR